MPGLRVLLVSCGAEETLQDGVRAFLARHRHELAAQGTWFVNLDTVGSPHLVMLEGEGPVWMEEYAGPWLRELLAASALRIEIPLERGFRARASTDSVIPSRAGYPIATLVSITDWRSPANYHLPSDVPANLDYGTIADATRLVLRAGAHACRGPPRRRRRVIAGRRDAHPGTAATLTRDPRASGPPPPAPCGRPPRRTSCRSRMRASNGSSAFSPVTA